MAGWHLEDAGRVLAAIETESDLEKALLGIPQNASMPNSIADLVAPDGQTLSIGIADELACMNYIPADGDPPYMTIVGDDSRVDDDSDVVVFRYGGDWTEILRRNCVSVEVMLRVAKYFFQHNSLPDWIGWDEV